VRVSQRFADVLVAGEHCPCLVHIVQRRLPRQLRETFTQAISFVRQRVEFAAPTFLVGGLFDPSCSAVFRN